MKHIRLISAQIKELDWGLNSGLAGFNNLINALISLLNAIGLLKGTGSN